MPKKKYFIKYDEPARLEISWVGGWFNLQENFLILYDGQLLGEFAKRNELEKGQEFQLPDGSSLKVSITSNDFNILHNGKSIQSLNNAKRVPIAALVAAVCFFILGLSTYAFKVSSWGIDFYESPSFYSTIASPIYVNLVGGAAISFSLAFILEGLYARRNYLFGRLGFYFLLFLVAVVFGLALPYQLGERMNIFNILLVLIWLFAFGIELYNLQKQRAQ
jgi:hypothetical protein